MALALVKRTPVVAATLCPSLLEEALRESMMDASVEATAQLAGHARSPATVGLVVRDIALTSIDHGIRDEMPGYGALVVDSRCSPSMVPTVLRSDDSHFFFSSMHQMDRACATSGVEMATNANFQSRTRRNQVAGVGQLFGGSRCVVIGWTPHIEWDKGRVTSVVINGIFVGVPIQVASDGRIKEWKKGSGWIQD